MQFRGKSDTMTKLQYLTREQQKNEGAQFSSQDFHFKCKLIPLFHHRVVDRGVYLFISEIFQRHSFYLLQVKALFFRYVCVHISVHRYDTPTLSLRPSLLTCHSSCDGDCVYLISNVLLYLSFVAWILYSWITQKVRAKTITRYPPESRSRAVVV